MIRKGDVIENPVTGERMLFLETSADTNGEYVLVEVTVQPNGFVAAAHMHPYQTERFEIESGTLAFKVDGEEIVAGAGRDGRRPAEELAQVLERGRDRGGLRLRGAAGAPVRAAARDDVRPRERRQDEPEGDAEPAPPRRDRERALRRRAPAVPAGLGAEGGAAAGRPGRPAARLQAGVRRRLAGHAGAGDLAATVTLAATRVVGDMSPTRPLREVGQRAAKTETASTTCFRRRPSSVSRYSTLGGLASITRRSRTPASSSSTSRCASVPGGIDAERLPELVEAGRALRRTPRGPRRPNAARGGPPRGGPPREPACRLYTAWR